MTLFSLSLNRPKNSLAAVGALVMFSLFSTSIAMAHDDPADFGEDPADVARLYDALNGSKSLSDSI